MNAPLAALGAALEGRPATARELAEVVARIAALEARLAQPIPRTPTRAWIDALCTIVAEEFGVTRAAIFGDSRLAHYIRPRFTFVWAVRTVGSLSYPQTATLTGYGDYTSVIYACRRVEGWREKSADFRQVTDLLVDIGRRHRLESLKTPLRGASPDLLDIIDAQAVEVTP